MKRTSDHGSHSGRSNADINRMGRSVQSDVFLYSAQKVLKYGRVTKVWSTSNKVSDGRQERCGSLR